MISVEKPGSPAEILEHHGVKGQKWGVRRKSSSSGGSDSFKKKFPTSQARTAEIHRARINIRAQEAKIYKTTNPAAQKKALKVYLNSPDRATALRMTRGEKIVAGVLAGALAIPTAGAATAGVAGYTGTTVAIRKGIERKQRKGK